MTQYWMDYGDDWPPPTGRPVPRPCPRPTRRLRRTLRTYSVPLLACPVGIIAVGEVLLALHR